MSASEKKTQFEKQINAAGQKPDGLNRQRSLDLKDPMPPFHLEQALKRLPTLCSGRLSTQKSLDVFFKLLTLTGLDSHSGYRLNFWQNYLNKGLIHQAWIALASESEKIARRELRLKSNQFAKIKKCRRVDELHSVLLMRVQNITIAEWSHSGKCRFWLPTNKHSPSFFKQIYTRGDLIDFADYIQQHYFSAKGLWQKDATKYLESIGVSP